MQNTNISGTTDKLKPIKALRGNSPTFLLTEVSSAIKKFSFDYGTAAINGDTETLLIKSKVDLGLISSQQALSFYKAQLAKRYDALLSEPDWQIYQNGQLWELVKQDVERAVRTFTNSESKVVRAFESLIPGTISASCELITMESSPGLSLVLLVKLSATIKGQLESIMVKLQCGSGVPVMSTVVTPDFEDDFRQLSSALGRYIYFVGEIAILEFIRKITQADPKLSEVNAVTKPSKIITNASKEQLEEYFLMLTGRFKHKGKTAEILKREDVEYLLKSNFSLYTEDLPVKSFTPSCEAAIIRTFVYNFYNKYKLNELDIECYREFLLRNFRCYSEFQKPEYLGKHFSRSAKLPNFLNIGG